MADSFPMTSQGLKRIKDELKQLQSVDRIKISQEIEVARAHGDLRENAEYHAAKEKQGHIEGRIMDLNGVVARAEIIDVSALKGSEKIVFGATVKLVDCETEKEATYRLVGEYETDIKKRWISITSPVARGLVGKKVGDIATIQSPGGAREFEIVGVEFEDI
ncbi:MAG: transcription elongation factor GreA [Myxococcaceae bacterium]|nr:transcription elongation factor GreA [Myxococcaceae bacterium]